jgi:hypothetical protein
MNRSRHRFAVLPLVMVALVGCGGPLKPPRHESPDGFKITPPPDFALRDREGGLPANTAHKAPPLPFPPLVKSEKLVVRYDRITSGRAKAAWFRVTVSDVPPAKSLPDLVATRAPGADWKREAEVETLEVAGLPAARVAFQGRWKGEGFLNETLAVQKDDRLYLISASFPAADTEAREATRQAALAATWN